MNSYNAKQSFTHPDRIYFYLYHDLVFSNEIIALWFFGYETYFYFDDLHVEDFYFDIMQFKWRK